MSIQKSLAGVFDLRTRLLGGVVVVLLLAILVVAVPKHQVQRDLRAGRIARSDIPQQVDAYRRTFIQLAGGLVVAIGLYLTWRRIEVTEEGQVTDRFSTATEQLGDESLEVRLGGIYALERIARDSPRDHWTVMENLSAFVRENASSSGGMVRDENGEALPKKNPGPGTDVQAACTVLERRKDQDPPEAELNLAGALVAGIDFGSADLSGVVLQGADLSGADLHGAGLSEADLRHADLRQAKDLKLATLCKAGTLYGAQLDPSVEEGVQEQCPELLDEPE